MFIVPECVLLLVSKRLILRHGAADKLLMPGTFGAQARTQSGQSTQSELHTLAGRQLISLYKQHAPDKVGLVEGLLSMQNTTTPAPSLTEGSST